MEHVRDLAQLQLSQSCLTIGSFDGVHRGHLSLIEGMVTSSQTLGAPAIVLTFFPHPSVVLRKRSPAFYITSPDEKAKLLGEFGVDYVITQRFDQELSKIEATDFLDILQRHLGFLQLWAGEDFALGHARKGNRQLLESEGAARGFSLTVVPPFMLSGEVVNSTRVREALRSGDVARVATYLGRQFALPGKVVRGAGRGKELGIATANLELWDQRAYPGRGVYACWAELGSRKHKAVTNIGFRPTFEEASAKPTVEAHLLDFDQEIIGQELTLHFVDRLRDERKFSGVDELLEQINRDIGRAGDILIDKVE
jgi:riboflavin kinase/FMN adenylyltransferase